MMAVAVLRRSVTDIFVQPRSVGAQLARNTFWAIAGSVSSQGSSLLAALVLGRVLGVKLLGELALVQATVILLGNLGDMGLALTTTKLVSKWREVDPDRAGRLLGWTLRNIGMSALAAAAVLALVMPRLPFGGVQALAPELWAACGVLVFDMLNRVQLGALSGLEAFESTARVQLSRGILMLPCVWIGAEYGGLVGALAGMSCVSLGTCTVGHWILKRKCRELSIRVRYGGAPEASAITTSASLWVAALLLAGSTWAATLLLSQQAGFSQLGLYNAADKWKTALTFLPQMLFQVTLPMLSNRQALGDKRGCLRIVYMALGATVGVTGAAAVVVASFSRMFMSAYGAAFIAGASVLSLTAAGSVVSAIYTVGAGVLWAIGKPIQMLGVDFFKTCLILGLCWAGLAHSAWSLALCYLLSFTVGSLMIMLVVRRQLGMQHG